MSHLIKFLATMLSYFPIIVLLVIPHYFILLVSCLSQHILCAVSRLRGSGLPERRVETHTYVFRKSDLQRFLAVGGEWAPVFVLQIIFLLGFSKIFEDVLRKSLKSYQIKSAQSDNWL